MRTVKILAGLLGAILVLAVAAIIAVGWFVDPNAFKGRIAAAVKEATGRELTLTGDLKLSVLPWVALEVGPASLGNPPGFGTEPFLAFQHAAVRVRLWPLLHQRLRVDRVEVEGLDVRLVRNADGAGNWENFGRASAQAPPGAGPTAGGEGQQPLPELAGVRITRGRVSIPGGVTLQNVTLLAGEFDGHGVTPLAVTFDVDRGVPGETLSVDARLDVKTADSGLEQLHLAAVNLSGLWGRAGDGRPAHWEMSAPAVDVDLRAHTLGAPAFAVSYSGAHVNGQLQATNLGQEVSVTGSLTLAPLVLREFAPRLPFTLPTTRDPRALAQLSGGTDFSYASDGVRLTQLEAQLDDTHFKGSAAFAGEPRALTFDLGADAIDMDRYMGAADAGPAAAAGDDQPAAGPGRAGAVAVRARATVVEAGAAWGPPLEGVFRVGAVHFSPLDFSAVRVTVAAAGGVVHLFPATAQIDGGTYSGNLTLDRRPAISTLSIDEHLSGVDMTRLLAGGAYKGRLSGRGNVSLKANAHGAGLAAFMRSLNGHFEANIADGALEGIDLPYEYGIAQSLIKHTEAPAPSNPRRTKFEAAKVSAEITHGVARTSDLTISTSVLQLTGQGSANLYSRAIDFKMLASVMQAPGASVADIPFLVTGTYVDPKVRADVETLAKGQLKQKLKDVLKKSGLQGLFGK